MNWFSTRASRKVQEQNDRLLLENARLVKSNGELDKALAEEIDAVATQLEIRCEEHRREHERQERRIYVLGEENKAMFQAATNAQSALVDKQHELDRALAEVKELHGQLSQMDVENLRLGGLLATAEEQIAGLKLGVA